MGQSPHWTTYKVGYWASIATFVFGGSFAILMGYEMLSGRFSPTNFDLLFLIPEFVLNYLLTFAFLVMISAVHLTVPAPRQIFSFVAVGFATAYLAIDGAVFYTQLSAVIPATIQGKSEQFQSFLFRPGSYQFALEFFGCTLSSLSTLALSFSFASLDRFHRLIKGFLFVNGLLAFVIATAVPIPWLWFNVVPLWSLTFPGSALLLALYFFRKSREGHSGV